MAIVAPASILELTEPQSASMAAANQLKDGAASQMFILLYYTDPYSSPF